MSSKRNRSTKKHAGTAKRANGGALGEAAVPDSVQVYRDELTKRIDYDRRTFWFWQEIVEVMAEKSHRHGTMMAFTHEESYVRLLVEVFNACRTARHATVLEVLLKEAQNEYLSAGELGAEPLLTETRRLIRKPHLLEFMSERDYIIQGKIAGNLEHDSAAALLGAARVHALEHDERDTSLVDRPLLKAVWAFAFTEEDCNRVRSLIEAKVKALAA